MLLLAITIKHPWKYQSVCESSRLCLWLAHQARFGSNLGFSSITKQNLTVTNPGLRAVVSSHLLEIWIHRMLLWILIHKQHMHNAAHLWSHTRNNIEPPFWVLIVLRAIGEFRAQQLFNRRPNPKSFAVKSCLACDVLISEVYDTVIFASIVF